MSKLPIKDVAGKQLGEFDIADELLIYDKGGQAVRDTIVAYRDHQRAGTASTLSKGEVSGTGAKPWRQKGLGRARAGYRQSPVWRGGSVVFGPKPRKFTRKVTRKTAKLAFRRAFSERVAAGQVVVLDELKLAEHKTKDFAAIIAKLEAQKGALILVDQLDRNLALSARNIQNIEIETAGNVNVYQLLRHPQVIITKPAMDILQARLQPKTGKAA